MPEEPIIESPRWGNEIAAAFVAAQAEMEAITKARTANMGSYSYTFADLASICDDIRPILAKHGLGHSQDVETAGGDVCVSTMIVHKSGQSVTCGPLSFKAGGTPQAAGSAITYMRRYALVAAFGLATEDDDGQSAAQPTVERAAEPVTAAQLTATAELAERVKATTGALREQITEVANRYGRGTTKAAFGADPAFAAEVEDILNGATA